MINDMDGNKDLETIFEIQEQLQDLINIINEGKTVGLMFIALQEGGNHLSQWYTDYSLELVGMMEGVKRQILINVDEED